MYIIYRKKIDEVKGILGACQSFNYLTKSLKINYILWKNRIYLKIKNVQITQVNKLKKISRECKMFNDLLQIVVKNVIFSKIDFYKK